MQQIILYQILSGITPYAFVRRTSQLVSFVVEEHGRPGINESWPSSVRFMMKDSFNADVDQRPVSLHTLIFCGRKEIGAAVLTRPCFVVWHPDKNMDAWLNGIRDSLVSLRGGKKEGLTCFAIQRRRTKLSFLHLNIVDSSEKSVEDS